jgi:hypothetical protein
VTKDELTEQILRKLDVYGGEPFTPELEEEVKEVIYRELAAVGLYPNTLTVSMDEEQHLCVYANDYIKIERGN